MKTIVGLFVLCLIILCAVLVSMSISLKDLQKTRNKLEKENRELLKGGENG